MKTPFAVLALTLAASDTAAQARYTGPLVDVHVHAIGGEGRLQELETTRTARALVSGSDSVVRNWVQRMPGRIIQSLALPCFTVARSPCYPEGGELPDPRWVRNELQAGRFRAFGELLQQYAGLLPTDPQLAPYFALAEEFDVPVGIHLALAPPNTPATQPRFRTYLGKPHLLEEVLAKHPRLRVYVMHAGYPYGDEMVALLYMYPNVYVDISAIAMPRFLPRAVFHEYLRRFVEIGFTDRIMYGSDYPGAAAETIEAIETAPFLTLENKRAIFCGNAVRFFHITDLECG